MMYGNGAAMGFSPRQVDEMSLWEFQAVMDGWGRSQGVETKAAPPSPEEHRARLERHRWH
jgi:hypothetical protein